jgi:Reverse transcriptase (RNA-dependent DNA polymerase)
MYWDEAMRQPDAPKFFKAAMKEIKSHNRYKNWKIILIEKAPKVTMVLDYVWSMKRKQRLLMNEIYKHKTRLNIHGGQQEFGINFWDTFAPVVRWATVHLVIILVLLYRWEMLQRDFIIAYTQADVECDLYMKIPKGFTIKGGNRKTHVIKLLLNLYR